MIVRSIISPRIRSSVDRENPTHAEAIQQVQPLLGVFSAEVVVEVPPTGSEILTELQGDLEIDEAAVAEVAVADRFGDADAIGQAVVTRFVLIGQLGDIVPDHLYANLVLDELGPQFDKESSILVMFSHNGEDLPDPERDDVAPLEKADLIPSPIRTDGL